MRLQSKRIFAKQKKHYEDILEIMKIITQLSLHAFLNFFCSLPGLSFWKSDFSCHCQNILHSRISSISMHHCCVFSSK